MSDEKFPLCKRAGLKVRWLIFPHKENGWGVSAADVEALLAGAPVVYGNHDVEGWSGRANSGDTHYGRLICVEPIVRDTAEGLLRELLDSKPFALKMGESWIERAKRLVGE